MNKVLKRTILKRTIKGGDCYAACDGHTLANPRVGQIK